MKIQCECGRMFSRPKLNKSGLCIKCNREKVNAKRHEIQYKKKREKALRELGKR